MVNKKKCIACGACAEVCPVGAIAIREDGKAGIDETKCIKCGGCEGTCPVMAIKIEY